MHHEIVALEGLHMAPVFPEFDISQPHTATQTVYHNTSPSELHERIKNATVIITTTVKLDANTLSPSITPHLQHVAVMASGTDCVDIAAAKARGILVSNCPHAPTDVVSEHAIGLYFATRRKTVLMHGITRAVPSEWKAKGSVVSHMRDPLGNAPLSCADEVCGIVGYGALGKRIAHLASALGMKVLIAARKTADTSTPTAPSVDSPQRTPFTEVLQKSTVLILCLPRTPSTLNLISTPELNLMSPQAVLINVARGLIVDESALLTALKEGRIAGAATDVFDVEPAEGGKDSVLLGQEAEGLNLTVTPHVAWFGERTKSNLRRILKGNVEGLIAGAPQNIVL